MSNSENNRIRLVLEKLRKLQQSQELDQLPEIIEELEDSIEKSREITAFPDKEKLHYAFTREALVILDKKKARDCTPALSRILQMSCDKITNNDFTRLIHPDDLNNFEKACDHNALTQVKCRLYKEDKSIVHVEMSIHPSDIPDRQYILIRDITDHVKLENQLRESENKFRNLANTTSVAIMIYQGEYWVYANPAAERISGYTLDELQSMKYWTIVHPDYRKMIQSRGQQRQKGEEVPSGYEFKIVAKDGRPKWVYLEGKLTIFNGKPAGLISIIEITHIKQVELDLKKKNEALQLADKQLQQSNERLNELNIQLQKQNAVLQKAKDKAEESDRLKSAFLANMSHEIRTPMNAIMGFAEILAETDVTMDAQREFGKTIYTRSQHLLQIINDIVDISKIEANLLSIHRKEFDLNKLFDELKQSFQPVLRKREKEHLTLDFQKSQKGEFIIYSDNNRLEQILTNLVGNAIKFTEQGSITIGYELRNKKMLEFHVTDTGSGINPDEVTKIFDRFVMARNAVNDTSEGTGLGLAISKSLAELLGGRIWIADTSDKGTSFHFTINIAKEEKMANEQQKKPHQANSFLHNLKILLVEDDTGSIQLMMTMLEEKGATLTIVQKGAEAVRRIKKGEHFDIILMDIRLPDINGLEVTQQIKAIKDIPIIAQTAYALNEDRDKALASGCDDYIAKPISIEKLTQLIEKHLK